MAQYKQVRRNGRWIWVDKNGKEVKLGQGPLGEAGKKLKNLARQARDMVVYSDKPGPNGKPQTIDEERRRSKLVHGPGGSPSGSGQGQAQQTSKPTSTKPKAKKPEGTKPTAKPTPNSASKSTASKSTASKSTASKPAASKPAPAKTTASKPASAPKSDKKRKSIAKTLEQLQRMQRRSKKRQEGKEPKMQGVGPYRSAKKYSAKMAGQPAKPAQAAKPNTKSKLRQAMEERMKKQRGRGY
jgi:hypothetical protein